ncbi:MAG: BlaI/MecI/CopY family transcriptional regulator [Syntrophomonadaceae bacterium]|nr:BlaI/MecI/CopY family transcriptional regulator [Syntrophomonadaceae bacterium]
MHHMQPISEAELEIMHIIWDGEEPLNSIEIRKRVEASRAWNKSTTFTLLNRLIDKGYLRKENRGLYYFVPVLSREEYESALAKSLLIAHYQGSAGKFISALFRSHDVSIEELDELIASLKRGE